MQKVKGGGRNQACKDTTDLSRPQIDWVALASGYGVQAVAVGDCDEFARELRAALQAIGPRLIAAQLSK